MYTCMVCHFEVVLDDVAVVGSERTVVCLRCYARLADRLLSVPRKLRLEIEECLRLPAGSQRDLRDQEH
jgi:hypothetical protein